VERPQSRKKLSEMTNEELAAAAQEAREELAKLRHEDGALVRDAMSEAVH
jgi:ribosomal protein L29